MRYLAALPILAALSQVDAQGIDFSQIMSAEPQLSSAKPTSTAVDSSSVASSIVSSLSSAHAQTATVYRTTLATVPKPTNTATGKGKPKSKSKKPKAKQTDKHAPVAAVAVSSSSSAASSSTGSPCTPQQFLQSYVPSPNTPNQFLVDSSMANTAATVAASPPAGYTKQFSGLFGSVENAGQYYGFRQLSSYNVSQCVSYCDSVPGCAAVNLYYERSPVLDPGVSCPSPAAQSMIKCALWGLPITSALATDLGQYRTDFMVVIQGSSGYTKNTPPSAIAGFSGPNALAGAVNVNTINGNNVFLNSSFTAGVYDPTICTAQCVSTTSKNKAAAALAGNTTYAPCNYVDAFVVSYNGTGLGTYCNLYTDVTVANYATQYSQAYNGVQYDVTYSYGYALSTIDSGVLSTAGASAGSSSSSSAPASSTSASGSSSSSSSPSSSTSSSTPSSSSSSSSKSSSSSSSASSSSSSSSSASASATAASTNGGVVSTSQTCAQLASTSSSYTDSSGISFALSCGHDLLGLGDLAAAASSSFQGCFYLCENILGCQAFTYTSGTCYFKTLVGVINQPSVSSSVDLAYIPQYYTGLTSSSSSSSAAAASSTSSSSSSKTSSASSTTSSASSTTSSSTSKSSSSTSTSATPASSTLVATCAQLGSTFLDSNNVSYNLYCGHDFLGVGDIGNKAVSSFAACFAACDSYTSTATVLTPAKKCQAIAYVGGTGSGTCYFKNMNGITTAPNANSGVDVAWLPSAYSYTVPS